MRPCLQPSWAPPSSTRTTRFLAGLLLLALAACGDDAAGPETPGLPEAAEFTVRIVASDALPIDSAVVRMEGPTPRTFSLMEGEEVVVDGLAAGAYQVAIEGWHNQTVEAFVEFTETLEAGARQDHPVTFERAFAPAEVSVTLDAGLIQLQWDSVPGAMEYVVESKADPEAAEAELQGRTKETSLVIGPFEAGSYTVLVQAVDRFAHGGPLATVSVTIEPERFPVTVQVEEGGELPVGSVVSEPEGILCGDGNAQCQAEFPAGEPVVLKHVWPGVPQDPSGDLGTGFGGWAGDCTGFDACVLTVDGPKEVIATAADELAAFGMDPFILSSRGFNVPGLVYWRLTWEEAGRTCEAYTLYDDGSNFSACGHARVAPGTRLTISSPVGPVDWSARPFGGEPLELCESEEGNTCHVVVPPGIQNITPVWDWSPPEGYSLLEVVHSELGLLLSDVGGLYHGAGEGYPLYCGQASDGWVWNVCSQVYPDGTPVTLTAEPIDGYRFTGWTGGGCSGVDPCVIEVEGWTRVEASFEPTSAPVLQPTDFCSDFPPDAIVTFEDASLEAQVTDALGLGPDDDLTCAKAATLTTLEVYRDPSPSVSDLTGLQNLSGLQHLEIWSIDATDIGPLRYLPNLTDLQLYTLRISDIGPLAGLTTLTSLRLESIWTLEDISPLAGLSNLTSLSLYETWSITDFSPLGALTNLESLNLSNTGLTDLGPLATLARLEDLELVELTIPNLRPLTGLPSLSSLNFFYNTVLRDVQPLLDNPGIGPGDWIQLEGTLVSCEDVALLEARGVDVGHGCLRITTTSLPDAAVDVSYSTTLKAAGWVTDVANGGWSVVDGGLPTGLWLTDDGEISGTPTEVGMFDFTVEYSTAVGSNVASARKALSLTVGSSLGTGFALDQFSRIPAGTFQMGDDDGGGNERPAHTVNITRDFYLQRTEVTQAQWREIMGDNPSSRSGCELCPVDQVSWDDVQIFLARLNAAYPDAGFRLPTEAEWEYAARAGTTGDYGGTGVLDEMGWYSDNAGFQTHPVALKSPNAWGLYDMHGNVKEWVQDRYSETYYAWSPTDDPPGPPSSCAIGPEGAALKTGCYDRGRVLRGGSWGSVARNARSSTRGNSGADWAGGEFGFRLARTR